MYRACDSTHSCQRQQQAEPFPEGIAYCWRSCSCDNAGDDVVSPLDSEVCREYVRTYITRDRRTPRPLPLEFAASSGRSDALLQPAPRLQCCTRCVFAQPNAGRSPPCNRLRNTYLRQHVQGGNDYEIFESERTVGHTVTSPEDTMKQCKELFFK